MRALPTIRRRTGRKLPRPGELLAQVMAAGASFGQQTPMMAPIESPLTFSGFHEDVLREFGPMFQQLGISAVQGGASGSDSQSASRPRVGRLRCSPATRSPACWYRRHERHRPRHGHL